MTTTNALQIDTRRHCAAQLARLAILIRRHASVERLKLSRSVNPGALVCGGRTLRVGARAEKKVPVEVHTVVSLLTTRGVVVQVEGA